jgi:hypothetical protein
MNDLSEEDKLDAKELYLSVAFIFCADRGQLSRLLEKLQKDHLQGYDGYPKSLQAAYNLLTNWKSNHPRRNGLASDGVSFSTTNVTRNSKKKKSDKSKVVLNARKMGIIQMNVLQVRMRMRQTTLQLKLQRKHRIPRMIRVLMVK